MRVTILKECGYEEALFGLGLSFGLTSNKTIEEVTNENALNHDHDLYNKLKNISIKLSSKDNGENSFLELIHVWVDITMSRFWWQEANRYRFIEQLSESTMHTLKKKPITQDDFESPVPIDTINYLNALRLMGDLEGMKNALPEGYLQRRIVCVNYKSLRNILQQRQHHKLQEWKIFCWEIMGQIAHPEMFQKMEVV
jgi:hypothetical protein